MKKSFSYSITQYGSNGQTVTEEFKTPDGVKTLTTDASTGAVIMAASVDEDSLNPVTGAAVAAAVAAGGGGVPEYDAEDAGKVLTVDAQGEDLVWGTAGGGASYTAGNGIDITNDEISVAIGSGGIQIDTGDNTLMIQDEYGLVHVEDGSILVNHDDTISEETDLSGHGMLGVANPVPTPGGSDSGKVLTVSDAQGNYGWAAAGGGGGLGPDDNTCYEKSGVYDTTSAYVETVLTDEWQYVQYYPAIEASKYAQKVDGSWDASEGLHLRPRDPRVVLKVPKATMTSLGLYTGSACIWLGWLFSPSGTWYASLKMCTSNTERFKVVGEDSDNYYVNIAAATDYITVGKFSDVGDGTGYDFHTGGDWSQYTYGYETYMYFFVGPLSPSALTDFAPLMFGAAQQRNVQFGVRTGSPRNGIGTWLAAPIGASGAMGYNGASGTWEAVLPNYNTSTDAGKVLTVTADGLAWVTPS